MTSSMPRRSVIVVLWVVVVLLGLVSLAGILSFGLFTLPLAMTAVVVLLVRPSPRAALAALLFGAGFGPFFLAYFNRLGPGHVCHTDSYGVACGDYLDPWPWLLLGVALWGTAALLWAWPRLSR